MRHALAAFLTLIVAAPSCLAWGEDGHVVVCKIAEANLNSAAKAAVKELLDDRSIADPRLCTWADLIRSSGALNRKYKNNDKWHYINIELTSKAEDFKPDPAEDHVISAIERFLKVVADTTVSKDDRKEALLFIIHFLGDMHQPLHCCHRNEDRGGNLQQIKSFCGQTETRLNLHWIWDTHLLKAEKGELTVEDFAARLLSEITDDQRNCWRKGTVKDWVWDSHTIAVSTVYRFADGKALPPRDEPAVELTDENYAKANRAIVREQLKKGGIRLAKVLNDCFPEAK
jgi:nuclease S1